jgi:hypothetical protein
LLIVCSFSIFMLLGLWATIAWIPGQEHSADGTVKTLEQWQKGRMPEKDYSETRWGKFVVKMWKWLVGVGDRIFMFLDGLSGGEERERRDEKMLADERELEEVPREGERQKEGDGTSGPRPPDEDAGIGARPFVNRSFIS